MKRPSSFWVKAKWDPENRIFWSESNIVGLHIEAPTLDEFQEVMTALVPELIAANHGERELIYSGKKVSVPRKIVKRHTANGILKDAGVGIKV